ncbi:hypothetical protein SAMN05216553_107422 [Lentzea fradiae]|uniref:Outer membrane protein OmpA n=1 Tax=Lentzea fradiae TaxID=200378 RepID=A0A1G7TSU2_9PSEU|nr:hypothetical protein [Lentzea fradiae]SDG37749.1 hypothetical protein SAMN05216553_107422 [Lentzea fradiae]
MKLWVPLAIGALVVPAALTAFGFSLYGQELQTALSASTESAVVESLMPVRDGAGRPHVQPVAVPVLPAHLAQQAVHDLFSSHHVKGVTFAPGTATLVGRGEAVRHALAGLLRTTTGSVTLVAHAWDGETVSHRCDALAGERAGLLRQYLTEQGVRGEITTRVVVDPVWGPPTDFGPQIDVLIS